MSTRLRSWEVPGILTAAEIAQSGDYLARLQLPSGQVPWFEGGHCDAWNHVEAAMALTATGHWDEARAAYQWLAATQRRDGSWFNYYVGDWVTQRRLDTNVCAYVATGLWHYLRVTNDHDFARLLWPTVARAMDFVLARQRPSGTFTWSLDERGASEPYALLTGSSSIFFSLRAAHALAEALDIARLDLAVSAGRALHALRSHPEAFAPKAEFAMDWYYPVLSGAITGDEASARIAADWDSFVIPGFGVRCVRPNNWATAAETSECVLTLDAMGDSDRATALFASTQRHRQADGSYLTGWVYPQEVTFPTNEATSYTVAAVLLAADALAQGSGGHDLFRHGVLGAVTEMPADDCVSPNQAR